MNIETTTEEIITMSTQKRVIPRETQLTGKGMNDAGWFVVEDNVEDVLKGINARLKRHGLQIVEGTDEDGGAIGGDWYLKIETVKDE